MKTVLVNHVLHILYSLIAMIGTGMSKHIYKAHLEVLSTQIVSWNKKNIDVL